MEETPQEIPCCSLCGGTGNSLLMATCSQCPTRQHLYCFQVVTFEGPDKWLCYECEPTEDVAPENQVKRNASAAIQCHNMNQGCVTDLCKDSRICPNDKRQKPVKTGKVRFIPTEEAIRLSSGTEKRDPSFKRNNVYSYNHPFQTRKSPPPIVKQNIGARILSSGALNPPRHNSVLISSVSGRQVGRAARELKPAPALELCIKKQQMHSVNQAGETKIGKATVLDDPINIRPNLKPPPMMDNCNKKQQTVSDDPIVEVGSHKDVPAETIDHRNIVSKLGKPSITENRGEEQKLASVSLEKLPMMDHCNKKLKIASHDLVGEVESHKNLSDEPEGYRNVVSKLGKPPISEHCSEEQKVASVSLELQPKMNHCHTKKKIASDNPAVEVDSQKDLPEEAADCRNVVSKLEQPSINEHCCEEQQIATDSIELPTTTDQFNTKRKIASNNPVGKVESHKDLPEETVDCRIVVSKLEQPSIAKHCGKEQQIALVHPANEVETPKTNVSTDEVTDPMDILPKLGLHLKYFPALGITWKGNIECSHTAATPKTYGDFQARPSCRTHRKAYQFLQVLPPVLQVKLTPLDHVLEELFQSDKPDFQDIGMYFFPASESDLARSKENYSSLFQLMESQNSVSRACVGGVELLIFTSKQLDSYSQEAIARSKAAHFLWGLFCPTKDGHSPSMVPKEFTASVSEYQDNANEDSCGVIDMEIDEVGSDDFSRVDVAAEKESPRGVPVVLEGETVDNDLLRVSENSILNTSEHLDSELNQLMLQSIKTQQCIASCLSEAQERIRRNCFSSPVRKLQVDI